MSCRSDSQPAVDRVRSHLGHALADSTDPEVRYALREALQLLQAVEAQPGDDRDRPRSHEREREQEYEFENERDRERESGAPAGTRRETGAGTGDF